jgi:hypothetical protein
MNTKVTVLAMVTLGLLSAGCSKGPSTVEDDPPPNIKNTGTDFYGLLRRVNFDHEPARTFSALAERSTLVVRGNMSAIAEGRTLSHPTGNRFGQHTAVIKFKVNEVLKGEPGGEVYIEVFRSFPTGFDELREALPTEDDVTFYLRPIATGRKVYDSGKGHPPGAQLYWMTNPQALQVLHDGERIFPLSERDDWVTR